MINLDKYERLKLKKKSLLDLKKKRLLDSLILNNILKDKNLIQAIMEIPLEKFIPEQYINSIQLYEDKPALFYYDETNPKNYRTISAPHMIVIMLQGLSLNRNDDLLILGAKSGYIAALAHKLAPKGEIVILEANSEIARITKQNLEKLKLDENIKIVVKNPLFGMAELSPWQKILVTGAIEQSKINPLLHQLDEDGGVLFAPIGPSKLQTDHQAYTQILRQNNQFFGKRQLQVRFSPLITQLEIDELELITDFEEVEIKESYNINSGRVTIKYTEAILDNLLPESQIETVSTSKQNKKLVISLLEGIIKNVVDLKIEGNLDKIFTTIDKIERDLEILMSFKKKIVEMKIKRMQDKLNQIRSCNILRKELEKQELNAKPSIDQKIAIINKQFDEINSFIDMLKVEIKRIKRE